MHSRLVSTICLCLCLAQMIAGSRPVNKYLPPHQGGAGGAPPRPSNQYLAPHNNLHYHGVNGGGHSLGHTAGGSGAGGSSAYGGHNRAAAQIPILRQHQHDNDGSGNYDFGFQTGNGIQRDETGQFMGGWPHGSLNVKGSYSYTGDDGRKYTVNYKADKNGFHAEGDHLPTPPPIPKEIQQSLALIRSQQGGGGHGHGGHHGGHGGGGAHGRPGGPPATKYLPPRSGGQQGYKYNRRHY